MKKHYLLYLSMFIMEVWAPNIYPLQLFVGSRQKSYSLFYSLKLYFLLATPVYPAIVQWPYVLYIKLYYLCIHFIPKKKTLQREDTMQCRNRSIYSIDHLIYRYSGRVNLCNIKEQKNITSNRNYHKKYYSKMYIFECWIIQYNAHMPWHACTMS